MVKLEKLEGIIRTLSNPRSSNRALENAEGRLFVLYPELESLNQNAMDAYIGEQLARLAILRRNRINAAKKLHAARIKNNLVKKLRSRSRSRSRSPSPARTTVQPRRRF